MPVVKTPAYVMRDAEVSACGAYRYWLRRVWEVGPPLGAFVMLNPSTADATADDPTVRRCVGFARGWGCGGLVVVNLFALRATDPRALRGAADPVGPDVDPRLLSAPLNCRCRPVVAGWGVHGTLGGRDAAVARLLAAAGVPLWCLGRTKGGHPKHPLYLPAAAALEPFPGPAENPGGGLPSAGGGA